jgi:hypothetical protein
MSDDAPRIPPEPAGTQPKVDVSSLLPARVERDSDRERERERVEEELAAAILPGRVDHDVPDPSEPRPEPPHAAKFQFILGALLAIGVVGLAALGLVLADRATKGDPAEWSAWKPTAGGVEGAKQIATHVSPQYKLSTGEQMVYVKAGELEAQNTKLRVAVRQRGETGGNIEVVEGDGILYELCGLDVRCAIKGEPSRSRGILLRRQALELALYSFKYLRGIDQVVMFMPPSFKNYPTKDKEKKLKVAFENQALLFKREDFEFALAAPLVQTIPAPAPAVRRMKVAPEATLVDNLTGPRAFTYSLVASNVEEEAFLVLERLTDREAIIRQRELDLEREKAQAEREPGPGGAEADVDQ